MQIPPGPTIDPTELTYTPDAIELGTGDIVCLLSKLHQSVFRWSLPERRYLESIPLTGMPQLMAYSPTHNRLYLWYSDGRVTKIELDTGIAERHFTNLVGPVQAMTATDVGLFVMRGHGKETYSVSGEVITVSNVAFFDTVLTWSETMRRLYSVSEYYVRSQVIDTEGHFGATSGSPFVYNVRLKGPVRVAPDGSRIVLGDGSVFRASDLTRIGALPVRTPPQTSYPNPTVFDAAWLNGQLFTLAYNWSGLVVQSWNDALQETDSTTPIVGTPLRLFTPGDRLLTVALVNGKPTFTLLDATLESGGPLPGGPVTRPNPARPLGPATAQWIEAARSSDVAYFLFAAPAKIERYNFATGQWIAPISLPATPTAFTVGGDGIYVAFREEVSRFSFGGGTETMLFTANGPVRWLHEDGGKLYYWTYADGLFYHGTSDKLSVVSTSTGALLSRLEFTGNVTHLRGLSFAGSRHRILARRLQGTSNDLVAIPLAADGTFEAPINNPNASDHPSAARTLLFADEEHFLDDSGSVYSTDDLVFRATIGGDQEFRPINKDDFPAGYINNLDLASIGDRTVVLRHGYLVAYSADLLEVGRKLMADLPLRIFTNRTEVISFAWQRGRGVAETRTPLAEIGRPQPAAAVDPTNRSYTPDALLMSGDVVFILSKPHRCVFRWSRLQAGYLASVPLANAPNLFAVSKDGQSLYFAYHGGRITKLNLEGAAKEITIGYTPATAEAFVAADEFLFASAALGYNSTRYVFDAAGHLLSTSAGFYQPSRTGWNPATRKAFSVAGTNGHRRLLAQGIGTDGVAGSEHIAFIDSEGFAFGGSGLLPTLPVVPDGSQVLFPNGNVYETMNFTRVASVGPDIRDAVWMSEAFFTLRFAGFEASELGRWSTSFQSEGSVSVPGKPVRIFSRNGGTLVVTLWNERPHFILFDRNLDVVLIMPVEFPEVRGAFSAALVPATSGAGPATGMVTLSLNASGHATGSLLIDGVRLSFRAQFDYRGHATSVLEFRGRNLVLSLQIATDATGKWIVSGRLRNATWAMTFDATRAEREVPPGRYVFELRGFDDGEFSSAMIGCGKFTISSQGRVRVVGSLAPNRVFSGMGSVKGNGTLTLSCRTDSGADLLSGIIQYADLTESDWSGYLQWTKPATDHSTLLGQTGVAYVPESGPLGLAGGGYADLTITGGDLPAAIVGTVFLESKGGGSWGVDSTALHLRVHMSGLISGSFVHSTSHRWIELHGTANQKTQNASGYFRSGDHFGEMRLVPHVHSGNGDGGSVIVIGGGSITTP